MSFPPLPVGLLIRPLALADLPGLLDVQRSCYGGGYVESAEVFSRRIACPTQCSLVLEVQGRVMAYLAAYDSMMGKVTQLHGEFEPAPHPDTLYLHDLAVGPQWAGQGYGQALRQWLWSQASGRGLRWSALVSVQDTQAYWQRQGYHPQPLSDATQRQRLGSYGPGAVYMGQPLVLP